jgi:hypothetical protein
VERIEMSGILKRISGILKRTKHRYAYKRKLHMDILTKVIYEYFLVRRTFRTNNNLPPAAIEYLKKVIKEIDKRNRRFQRLMNKKHCLGRLFF